MRRKCRRRHKPTPGAVINEVAAVTRQRLIEEIEA
jgi:hypothetical protein